MKPVKVRIHKVKLQFDQAHDEILNMAIKHDPNFLANPNAYPCDLVPLWAEHMNIQVVVNQRDVWTHLKFKNKNHYLMWLVKYS